MTDKRMASEYEKSFWCLPEEDVFVVVRLGLYGDLIALVAFLVLEIRQVICQKGLPIPFSDPLYLFRVASQDKGLCPILSAP